MRLIRRHIFLQLFWPTLWALVALTLLALLAEGLSVIGLLLDQRQSGVIFVKVVLLATPQLVLLVLPVAVLTAGLMVINRMHRDNELAICFAGGMSPWRTAGPAVTLGALAAALGLALSLWAQPASFRALRTTLDAVRTDLISNLVRPGRFTHPGPGMTVWARAVDETGGIHDLFLHRRTPSGRDLTITAREGRIRKIDGGPYLYLRQGQSEDFKPGGALSVLGFDTYALDLRPMLAERPILRLKASDRWLNELFTARSQDAWERANARLFLAEAVARFVDPLYSLVFALLAPAAILGGAFDRAGYSRRIAVAAVAALAVRLAGFGAQSFAAASDGPANLLQLVPPALLAMTCVHILLRAGRGASA